MNEDAKSAKADAKAAKARAKALRPWYKKKRILIPAAVVVLIVVIVAASSGKGPSTPTGGNKSASGCLANPPAYAGAVRATDCVAKANHAVEMANTTVTATWSVVPNSVLGPSVCAAVVIRNHNSDQISYNDIDWQLQTPSGKIESTNLEASKDLGAGSIVAGGSASGNVCFDKPDQSGTYVGLYQPDPFNKTRGVWLTTLN